MPKITFKAKPETIYNMDETVAYVRVKLPELARRHCDMNAFRNDPKYRDLANSDLFPSVLKRAVAPLKGYVRLDRVPTNVQVDTTGFMAQVTIDI